MLAQGATTDSEAAPARRQLILGVLTLVGLYLVVFGPAVITALRTVLASGVPAAPAVDWQDRAAQVEGDVFGVVVVLGIVLRWLPRHAPDVVSRLGLRRPSGGALIAGASAYVAVALGSGWLGDYAVAALDLSGIPAPDIGAGNGALLMGSAAATAAAITEEITLLALVVAVVEYGARTLNRRPWWLVPVTLSLAIALRWTLHIYYGWGSLFVLAWVPGVYLLYRCVGSVWPLVLGHTSYDVLLTAKHVYPSLASLLEHALVVVAAGGSAAVIAMRYRVRTKVSDPARPVRREVLDDRHPMRRSTSCGT